MIRRALALLLWLTVLVAGPACARGQVVWVVLSGPDAPYQDAANALRGRLNGHEVIVRSWQAFEDSPDPAPDVVVTLGVEAFNRWPESSHARAKACTVAALAPRITLEKRAEQTPGRLSGVYFDQPFNRLAQFIRLAMPDRRRVGVLLGPDSLRYQNEIRHALKRFGLEDVIERVAGRDDLPRAVRTVLAQSDVVLALPDPQVHNNQTAHHLLLASYRAGVPVVGYSASFVKAGAAAALVSTPVQIGRQTGDLVLDLLVGGACNQVAAPDAFEVMVNANVARSLELNIDADALEKRMGVAK